MVHVLGVETACRRAGKHGALSSRLWKSSMQIGAILADLKKGGGNFDVAAGISQALTLTQECLFIFATCKNLYLTSVNEDLKDEVRPRLHGPDCECL